MLAEPSIFRVPVKPSDIALCIAMPTDYNSFARWWAKRPDEGDYLKRYSVAGDRSCLQVYEQVYRPVAQGIASVNHYLEAAGVKVMTEATLGDIAAASRERRVLIFAGHWKGYSFCNWDFLMDSTTVVGRLRSSGDNLVRSICAALAAKEPETFGDHPATGETAIPHLRSSLNAALKQGSSGREADVWTIDSIAGREPTALRERLDRVLGGAVVHGNRFELADRFANALMFAEALVPNDERILDCIVCKSNFPIQVVRRHRPLVVPISSLRDRHPLGWPRVIEATVRLLDRASLSYIRARELAMKLLTKMARGEL